MIASRTRAASLIVLGVALLISHGHAVADAVRFEILSREPFADGHDFDEVGSYERIVGRVHYEVDPRLRQNRAVVDIDLVPTDEDGLIRFQGDLDILAPSDLSRASGSALYDVNNRGNKLALRMFNDANGSNAPKTMEHAGNGFLMRHGFIVVWSGWDGELLPGGDRLRLSVPFARGNGGPITGPIRCEIVPTSDTSRTDVNWANHGSYRPTARGLETATLTHRVRPGDQRVAIPRDAWSLHVSEVESDTLWQLPRVELEYGAGLKSGHIYELIYEGQNPMVQGLGFVALRNMMSALKDGSGDGNPLVDAGQPVVDRTYGFGVSQSGRFLREFLYWGFNEDTQGQPAFDGLIPHVAGGGLGSFNHRFAQPTRHVTQHDHHDYPADRFPFTYATQCDPLSGQLDGLMRRANSTGTAPLVMHTQSSAEYWTRSGSLVHTDPLGRCDAVVPENVRIYSFGGTQHGPAGFPPSQGDGQNLLNPGDYRPFLRSLLLALDVWSRNGTPPPASAYPRFADGTLVDWRQRSTGFPVLPGVRYPEVIQQPSLWDYGPRWQTQRIIDRQPPLSRGDYRVLVACCGADGNELGCLLPPEVVVPVATHTGWNLRRADAGAESELLSLSGSYIPFPVTEEDRESSGDPRRSLAERYGSLDGYLEQLRAACAQQVSDGYLLAEDVDRIVDRQRERVGPLLEGIGVNAQPTLRQR